MRKLLVVLGVPIDDLSMGEALDRIGAYIAEFRRDGRLRQVATVNADFVIRSFNDPELLDILQNSDMLTADGMPLVWGARLLGVEMGGRVTGADMVPALAERAAKEGWSLYLLGARPGVAVRAGEILQQRYPGLRIVGHYSPPVSSIFEMDPVVLEHINAAKADILLVAFGNPKQEKWINMHRHELRCGVAIGVGGTFDFVAGQVKRAPAWMQRAGLEWLYRLVQEPRRLWKRYVLDLAGFGYFFFWQWLQDRRGQSRETVLPRSDLVIAENRAIISIVGRLDLRSRAHFVALADQALAALPQPQMVVNLREASFVDSAGLGALVQIAKRVREQGGQFHLADVPKVVAQTLAASRLDHFFEFGEDVVANLQAAPAPMGEAVRLERDAAVVRMPGRVDVTSLPVVKGLLDQAILLRQRIILDLANTKHIDSAGLSLLISATKKLREAGGDLRLLNAQSQVKLIIQVSKLDAFFTLYSSLDEAMSL